MAIRLSRSERRALTQILRSQRGEARLYRRARMVLLAADGTAKSEIARQLATNRSRVGAWLQGFERERLAGLVDAARSGRPMKITALERHQVVAAACRSPRDFGLMQPIWTHASLRETLIKSKLVREISVATVGAIVDGAEIKPHRVKMWCHSIDPAFQEKMRAIVALYVRPPRGQPVLCIDEKTGMQALSRARALQPAASGRGTRFDFEYRRHGTRCLFGCFNIATGRVVGRCATGRTREDFFDFMDLVPATYRQRRVHVILDNLNTHKDSRQGAFLTDWN